MGRTDGLAQLFQQVANGPVYEGTLASVDVDQANVLASIGAGNGNSERVEGSSAVGPSLRVERD